VASTPADKQVDYTRQAGLGPWTQLLDEVVRLQVLNEMGRAESVLTEAQRLREYMQTLPSTSSLDESANPWNTREALLDTGRYAARQLGRWEDALDLNSAVAASMRDRAAPAAEMARSRFNDYFPLLHLGRADEALALLLECRQVFQDAHDIGMLGKTFGALADVEDSRGHREAAIHMQRDALRYTYLAGDVLSVVVSYHNLGNYIHRYARQPAAALACHLTAALIRALTGGEGIEGSVHAAVTDLRKFGADATMPADVPGLCHQIGDIPGADLDRLLEALSPDRGTLEQLFQELVAAVREAANQEEK
jgi:tetratricopeptide (TPR) repeat protein